MLLCHTHFLRGELGGGEREKGKNKLCIFCGTSACPSQAGCWRLAVGDAGSGEENGVPAGSAAWHVGRGCGFWAGTCSGRRAASTHAGTPPLSDSAIRVLLPTVKQLYTAPSLVVLVCLTASCTPVARPGHQRANYCMTITFSVPISPALAPTPAVREGRAKSFLPVPLTASAVAGGAAPTSLDAPHFSTLDPMSYLVTFDDGKDGRGAAKEGEADAKMEEAGAGEGEGVGVQQQQGMAVGEVSEAEPQLPPPDEVLVMVQVRMGIGVCSMRYASSSESACTCGVEVEVEAEAEKGGLPVLR